MNKSELYDLVQNYINGQVLNWSIDIPNQSDELNTFYYRTTIRLLKSFDLFKKNESYKNDFLLALRDFLLVFDIGLNLSGLDIPDDNEFAIRKNTSTGEYYCTFQFPEGVIADFAESAFMRGISIDKPELNKYNLLTDSLIYRITGFKYFKSMSQKLAVYGALNTPSGYTTLVSLPTGGGKSLITQMMAYQSEGLTIVIVPTVSLADDQLIAARHNIKSENIEEEVFAYHTGIEKMPIISSIQKRTARLLFISPEALMNNDSFDEIMKTANKQHYLKNIIIDEAHIVVDWGTSFRVDYQCLEAWRRNLLITNPMIRTILLSATYESMTIDVLKKLFSERDNWIEVRCDALRHEPRFMLIKEKGFKQKDKKTVELVQKLPHPMIIYVAKPDDAERIKSLLSVNGINNVYTYTGVTSNNQREKILKEWKANEFEIMIATSAFGVGVDKPDVRTVLHLYIPPNPNAYYQELGRGGRDQLPCLSVMCTHPKDLDIAFQRINKRVMTTVKIAGRWDSMYNNMSSIRSGNIIHINTAIKPYYSSTDEWDDAPTSDTDMNWNIYVLLLFRRYDLIDIVSITNDKGVYIITIRIKNDILLKRGDELVNLIEPIRASEWNYYSSSYKTMEKAVEDYTDTCWSQMFFYTYDKIYEYCAGCNAHTKINNNDKNKFPLKNKIKQPIIEVLPDQQKVFEGQDELIVFAKGADKTEAIKYLDKIRLSCIITSESIIDNIQYFERVKSTKNTYIVGYNGAKELLRNSNYYFVSGVIAVIYPETENEIVDIFNTVQKYLCHTHGIHVIHILSENIFINRAGKNIADLIEGRVVSVDILRK